MSGFSCVDRSPDPGRLIRFLDESAAGLAAMKQYVAVTHALRRPLGPILSLGCGAGHDLELLGALDVACVGLDPSRAMLHASAGRSATPLVAGRGEALPFPDEAFAGCWIERVLMHVEEPAVVVAEAVRCTREDGILTVLEPDWSSLVVDGSTWPAASFTRARQPSVGSEGGTLLEKAGCTLLDRVEERSWWTFAEFERLTNLSESIAKRVEAGGITSDEGRRWLEQQQQRAAGGGFRAGISKILWVASKR